VANGLLPAHSRAVPQWSCARGFSTRKPEKSSPIPEFYAHAAAMGGAFSVGGTDNAMLVRIANSLAVYVFSNYRQAVGGPVMPTETEADSIATD
jgi:hypothetical protein